jgi:hypothetical protein
VFVYLKAALFSGFVLKGFNIIITKLFNAATLHAHNMVVMAALVKLKHGFAAFKVVAHQEACLFKLCEYAVNRC